MTATPAPGTAPAASPAAAAGQGACSTSPPSPPAAATPTSRPSPTASNNTASQRNSSSSPSCESSSRPPTSSSNAKPHGSQKLQNDMVAPPFFEQGRITCSLRRGREQGRRAEVALSFPQGGVLPMQRFALSLPHIAALSLPALAQDATTATANVMDLDGNSLSTL